MCLAGGFAPPVQHAAVRRRGASIAAGALGHDALHALVFGLVPVLVVGLAEHQRRPGFAIAAFPGIAGGAVGHALAAVGRLLAGGARARRGTVADAGDGERRAAFGRGAVVAEVTVVVERRALEDRRRRQALA